MEVTRKLKFTTLFTTCILDDCKEIINRLIDAINEAERHGHNNLQLYVSRKNILLKGVRLETKQEHIERITPSIEKLIKIVQDGRKITKSIKKKTPLKCPSCKKGKLKTVGADKPWHYEYLICNNPACQSTYNNKEEVKKILKKIISAKNIADKT